MSILKQLYFFLSLIPTSIFAQQQLDVFTPLNSFGSNPGELSASFFSSTIESNNLVVLLHGCSQNGEQFAMQSGFLGLAKQHQFNLLIPQQNKNNNIQSCFNWFSPQDQQLNQGESLSLKQMVETLKEKLQVTNVYIAGFSAGGAMTSAMLINYPDTFNAGAIVSGIAYPCADNLTKAISCMRNGPSQTNKQLVQLSKAQNPTVKHWPRLSIWTGDQDNIVVPVNAERIAQQWIGLTGLVVNKKQFSHSSYQQEQWRDSHGEVMIELVQITEIGHGFAVNNSIENGGTEAPFFLNTSLSAANEIIKFWFLN